MSAIEKTATSHMKLIGTDYCDDLGNLAPCSKKMRDLVNEVRKGYFEVLLSHPTIRQILEHSSVKYRDTNSPDPLTKRLTQLLARLRLRIESYYDGSYDIAIMDLLNKDKISALKVPSIDRMENLWKAADGCNQNSLYLTATIDGDKSLRKSIHTRIINKPVLNACSYISAALGDIETLKEVLPHSDKNTILCQAIRYAIRFGHTEIVKYLLNLLKIEEIKITTLFEYVVWNKPEWISDLLDTGNHFSSRFCRFAGVNDERNDARGLHLLLIEAVHANRLDVIQHLVSELTISQEMLEHAIDRAHYIQNKVNWESLIS